MMKIHTKVCLCATVAVALLAKSASAGTIASAVPDLSSPGLGVVTVPLILNTTPNNDNSADANSGNNINILTKAFEFQDYIDIVFTVAPSSGTTEYRVVEVVDNDTGFDWTGYNLVLGFGTGAGFMESAAGDGLDFDTPDNDPAPTSGAFGSFSRPSEDRINFFGGTHGSIQQPYEFRIDVPDIGPGPYTFTLRQLPIPEPSTFMLAGLAMLVYASGRRRG
jgi:hypothetical protein